LDISFDAFASRQGSWSASVSGRMISLAARFMPGTARTTQVRARVPAP